MERECLHITKNLLVEKDLRPSISGLLHRFKEDRKRSHILLGYFQSTSRSFYLLLDQFATKNWSASGAPYHTKTYNVYVSYGTDWIPIQGKTSTTIFLFFLVEIFSDDIHGSSFPRLQSLLLILVNQLLWSLKFKHNQIWSSKRRKIPYKARKSGTQVF